MKILITGGKGLLAFALGQIIPAGATAVLWDLEEFDITSAESMRSGLEAFQPDWVINTAAYNLVDRCELERDLSWAVNARGPEQLAALCAKYGCRLVHFSSDYVFDGCKRTPYCEEDPPNPLNHYGAGKLHGERSVLIANDRNLVFRTSWMFGPHPTQKKSYVHSVLQQAQQGNLIRATTDQIAAPTYAPDIARAVFFLLSSGASGLFHCVNTDGLSRYDWTLAIIEEARKAGLQLPAVRVEGVPTSFFGSNINRPRYTVLANEKLNSRISCPIGSWRDGLRTMLRNWRG